MKQKIVCVFIFFTLFLFSRGQVKPETLTNAGVIKLFKAGLDADIIQSKIALSTCKFDLSGDGLIALKSAGLSSEIIKSMMSKSEPVHAALPVPSTPGEKAQPANADKVPDAEMINAVYFYDKPANSARQLEKQSATMKTQMKMLGYGGTNFVFQVPGNKSSSRFDQEQVNSFLVNTGSGPADIFVLYKVEVKKNSRQAIGAKFALTGMKGSQGVIATDIKLAKTGVYELIPITKLEKGEYFFALKSATNSVTSSTDVYAFGVD